MINTIVFMGLPGSGKGKQSELLSAKTGYPICSTGAELRKLAAGGSALGKKVADIMATGGLNPSWLATYVFQKSILELPLDNGVIFEGVGRKKEEAQLFAEICEWLGRDFRIINLVVAEDTSRDRLNKRRDIESRADDHPDVLNERFKNYHASTSPALEYFRSIGKVIDINGEPLPDVVAAEIEEKLSKI